MRNPLIELGAARFEAGYWQGMRQPAVQVLLELTRLEVAARAVHRFDELAHRIRVSPAGGSWEGLIDPAVARHPILSRLLNMALAFLNNMGMPVMGGATAVRPDNEGQSRRWMVGLPAIAPGIQAPQAAFSLACSLMNALAAGQNAAPDDVASAITALHKRFRPLAPSGVNTLRFLQVAHEMGIPWRHVANNVYQFGWGSRSRWLDSSFTDETSTISASLARDKVASAKVLRVAGLPVPRHQLVASAEQAVQVADALGYPVVVKPANLDGGAGVMAGLLDALAVTQAVAVAAKHSKRILVEEFVQGEDYRIRICKGDVIGAVIRKAAAVVGDGGRSVRALIERTNAERSIRIQPLDVTREHGTKPIVIDEEVLSWLRAQGMTLDSVVPRGHAVRLRGAANVNLGGTTWDVTQQAHPDNLELAVRAAAALRLDVAGVDLLLPDIAQSWKTTGGAVCEVNAQPQFTSGSAHRKVLERLVHQRGRIPVIGVLRTGLHTPMLEPLVHLLQQQGIRVEVSLNSAHCHQALMCSQTDALIWLMQDPPLNTEGMPLDQMDVLIHAEQPDGQPMPDPWAQAQRWVIRDDSDIGVVIERLQVYLMDVCGRKTEGRKVC
jgi:cyanophycin synthetase